MAASFLVIKFAYTKPAWANKYLLLAMRNTDGNSIPLPNGDKIELPEKAQLEAALWITAHKSNSDEDVEDWLATIGQLTSEQMERLKNSDVAKDNAVILCDSIWLREYRKPESDRDWDNAERLLASVEKVAREIGFPLLRAAAIRTQILILAEWRGKLDEAVTRAEAALIESQNDDERFLLREVTGRQLAYADRWTEGIKWLQDALALSVDGFLLWQRNVLITLSEGIGQSNPSEAARYTKEAIDVSEKSIDPLQTAEAIAEHAISLWFASDQTAAFDALQRGVEILMSREQVALWKKTFLLFLHIAGYFGAVAFSGSPPTPKFERPHRGMFLASDNISADLYQPVQQSLLFIRLAMFADGIGNVAAAGAWTKRALERSSNEAGIPTLVQGFSWLNVAPALLLRDWQVPVEVADLILGLPAVPPEIWNEIGLPPDSDKARISTVAESALRDRGIQYAVFPLVLRLATLRFAGPITKDLLVISNLLGERSGSNAKVWREISDLIAAVFSPNPEREKLYQLVGQYYADGKIGFGMIATAGCILHSTLRQSLAFQVRFAQTIEKLFPKRSSIRREIVESFFLAYWKNQATVGDVGFRTAPSYAQRRVEEISMGQHGTRLRLLLREMVFCIGLKVPDEDRTWLEVEETA